jgi:hypothetical protein
VGSKCCADGDCHTNRCVSDACRRNDGTCDSNQGLNNNPDCQKNQSCSSGKCIELNPTCEDAKQTKCYVDTDCSKILPNWSCDHQIGSSGTCIC